MQRSLGNSFHLLYVRFGPFEAGASHNNLTYFHYSLRQHGRFGIEARHVTKASLSDFGAWMAVPHALLFYTARLSLAVPPIVSIHSSVVIKGDDTELAINHHAFSRPRHLG
jgi:hypothetical protein